MTIVRRILPGLILILALARVALYFAYVRACLGSPMETYHLESKMVLLAYRAQAGLTLYPEWRDYPHVANFFAPLYFMVVGLVGRVARSDLHGLFWIGRLVSFVAAVLTSAVVGVVAARRYGKFAGLVGGATSLGSAPLFGFSAMVRPDTAAEFLGVAGFVLATARRPRVAAAGVAVLVAAALTKQTAIVYAGAAALAWVVQGQWRRGLALGAGVGLGLVAIVGLVTLAVEPRFLEGLTGEGKTPWDREAMAVTASRIWGLSPDTFELPLLGLWFWLRRGGPDARRDPVLAVLAVALLLSSVVTAAKHGSDLNYYLGIRAAAGLAAAVLVDSWTRTRGRGPLLALGVASVVAGQSLLPGIVAADATRKHEEVYAQVRSGDVGRQMLAAINRLEALAATGRVKLLTDSGYLDIQRRDRAVFGDPWLFRMLVETGRIDPKELRRRILGREYDLVVTTSDILKPEYDTYHFGLPKILADPVRRGYVLTDRVAAFFLYQRRAGPMPGDAPRAPSPTPSP